MSFEMGEDLGLAGLSIHCATCSVRLPDVPPERTFSTNNFDRQFVHYSVHMPDCYGNWVPHELEWGTHLLTFEGVWIGVETRSMIIVESILQWDGDTGNGRITVLPGFVTIGYCAP